jgi:ABC-type dipeptide/oligopeptide/nickel transport system permease component
LSPAANEDFAATRLLAAILRRLVVYALFLLILHAALFSIFLALPSAAATIAGMRGVDPEFRQRIRHELGEDLSWMQRYGNHLARCAQLDFGETLRGSFPVGALLKRGLARSLPLFAAVGVGALAGAVTPLWLSVPRRSWRRWKRVIGESFLLPPFVLAAVAYALFRWLSQDMPLDAQAPLRWCIALLAAAAFPFVLTAGLATPVCDELAASRFTQTYRAIGLSWPVIRLRLLRNLWQILLPGLARVMLLAILSTAFIEWLFDINGFGALALRAFVSVDFNLMFACCMVAGALVMLFSAAERWQAE